MKTVILTNEQGENLGTEEAAKAHQGEGMLHKAFSVFVFRKNKAELLLHKRAAGKRFGNLWTNTCCSHPQEGETVVECAEKRLMEEMGFHTPLAEIDSFIYMALDTETGECEYEYDTVLVGEAENPDIQPDAEEVSEWKWVSIDELAIELDEHPEAYTPWFPEALSIAMQ